MNDQDINIRTKFTTLTTLATRLRELNIEEVELAERQAAAHRRFFKELRGFIALNPPQHLRNEALDALQSLMSLKPASQ